MLTPRFSYSLCGWAATRPRTHARQRNQAYCAQRRAGSQARDFDLLIRRADWLNYDWKRPVEIDTTQHWEARSMGHAATISAVGFARSRPRAFRADGCAFTFSLSSLSSPAQVAGADRAGAPRHWRAGRSR